ncbi:MAG: TRAP transporter small permease [Rhodobiaceae bacterium]|nr:TRAP transporter small permease [Rhodobiaceae bacterium]
MEKPSNFTDDGRTGPEGPVRTLIRWWALGGGFVLCALAIMTVISVTLTATVGTQVPGDFEMTEIGVAVAVFMFLPYTQLTGANVTVDIFTARAGRRFSAIMVLASSAIALLFSILLIWRMSEGMLDLRSYNEVTGIIGFPIWTAFIPMLMSLVLLLVASLVTTGEAWHEFRESRT